MTGSENTRVALLKKKKKVYSVLVCIYLLSWVSGLVFLSQQALYF